MWSKVKYAITGAILAGSFGCTVALPKMMCGPGDYGVISEYQNQEAFDWSDLEEIAEEVDHPVIDWLVHEINYVFFEKFPPLEHVKNPNQGLFPDTSFNCNRHPWRDIPDHPWNRLYIKETFQVKCPKHGDSRIQYRSHGRAEWEEFDMEGDNRRAVDTLEMLIRAYADRMAFRKIYIQK